MTMGERLMVFDAALLMAFDDLPAIPRSTLTVTAPFQGDLGSFGVELMVAVGVQRYRVPIVVNMMDDHFRRRPLSFASFIARRLHRVATRSGTEEAA